LLMCYSNVLLAPEDVEHLLQYGAVPKGNMDSTGWGLLDVYTSLKLIEQPEYRVMHFDTVLTSGAMMATPGTIPIYLTSDYDTIQAGLYSAQPYQYVANFSYNLGTGVSLAASLPSKPPYWVRNSASRLWGPNGILVGGSSQEVVPVDQVDFFSAPTASSASISGYYYEVFLSPTESVVIPYGADSSARLGFSLLAYNPEGFTTDWEDELQAAPIGLKLFPNPTSGFSTLEYALFSMQSVDLQLLDISGRELWHSHLGRMPGGIHQQGVPTANLPAGIYLLRLRAGEQSSYVKLIKQ